MTKPPTIDPEVLKRNLQVLAKLDPEKAFHGMLERRRRRKSLTDAITEAVKDFFGFQDVDVAKVGRKISAQRLKIIKEAVSQARAASDRLEALVKEVEDEPDPDDHAKGGAEMKPEEIKAAVEAAIKPVGERLDQVTTRLDAVEKVVNKAADPPPDKDKKADPPAADVEVIKSAVAALDERLKGVEKVALKSKQPEGDNIKDKKGSDDPFGDAVRDRRDPVVPPHPGFRMPVRT